ncbi:hypothetical protein HZB94_03675 [Candidatus Falkowbacteria bacterium]|nr:hypothetical protein [Candidatus Falkowbacteria bacterium]
MNRHLLIIILFLSASIIFPLNVDAKVVTLTKEFVINAKTAERGITVKSEDNVFQIGIFPKVLSVEAKIVINQFDKSLYKFPEGWMAAGDVYSYEIIEPAALIGQIRVLFNAGEPIAELEKIFIFENEKWRELDSKSVGRGTARVSLSVANARLALLRNEKILEFGQASWYKYKNCLCAASPDYPKGTKLKVQNLNNGKEVVVLVNDYGPDRSLFPARAIDLDKVAFKRLGPLGAGVLKNIKVTKVGNSKS